MFQFNYRLLCMLQILCSYSKFNTVFSPLTWDSEIWCQLICEQNGGVNIEYGKSDYGSRGLWVHHRSYTLLLLYAVIWHWITGCLWTLSSVWQASGFFQIFSKVVWVLRSSSYKTRLSYPEGIKLCIITRKTQKVASL